LSMNLYIFSSSTSDCLRHLLVNIAYSRMHAVAVVFDIRSCCASLVKRLKTLAMKYVEQ